MAINSGKSVQYTQPHVTYDDRECGARFMLLFFFFVFCLLLFFFLLFHLTVRKRTKESSRAVGGDGSRLDTRQKNFNDNPARLLFSLDIRETLRDSLDHRCGVRSPDLANGNEKKIEK